MKSNYITKAIGSAALGLALLSGIVMLSTATAQGQYPNYDPYQRQRDYEREQRRREREQRRRQNDDWYNNGYNRYHDGYANYGGSFDLRQTALNAGYNEGIKEGRRDRSHGNRYDFRDSSSYQRASKDYSSRLGDRYIYARYFRDAFANGYADGLRGY